MDGPSSRTFWSNKSNGSTEKEYESGYVIDVLEHYSRNFNNPNIDNKRFVIPSVDQSVYLSFLQVYIIFEK